MKINIGPFVNRWTTTSFENWWLEFNHNKPYFDVVNNEEEDDMDRFVEKWCDRWQTVLNLTINQYLDRKERKVKIQIDRYDTWSMDNTLSLIILPMLIQLKATKHGSPMVDDKDVPKNLRSNVAPDPDDEYSDLNVHRRWDWVMDELIWTFTQQADDENDSQFHTGKHDIVWTPVDVDGNEDPDGRYRKMGTGPNDTHVYDRKAHKKHQARIARGLKLFGKYYQGLWD